MRSSKQHLLGLDALRALAIVGVTFFHMFPDTLRGGYLGVSLFFVLTGYLLAYTTGMVSCRQVQRFALLLETHSPHLSFVAHHDADDDWRLSFFRAKVNFGSAPGSDFCCARL